MGALATDPAGLLCNCVGALAEACKHPELRRGIMQVPYGGGGGGVQCVGVRYRCCLGAACAAGSVTTPPRVHVLARKPQPTWPLSLAPCADRPAFPCSCPPSRLLLQLEFGESLRTLLQCVVDGPEPAQVCVV